MKYICLVILVLGLFSVDLYAQDHNGKSLDLLNKEREKADEDIKKISSLIDNLEVQQKDGIESLTLLQKKIDTRKQKLNTIDKQIDELKGILNSKQEAIEILQAELKDLQRSYAQLLIQYYSYRNKSNWLMYIMASESVSQAYRRIKYLREILYILKNKANQIAETTDKLNKEITSMAQKQRLLNSNLDDKQKEVATLQKEENVSKNVLHTLQSKKKDMVKRLEKRKKESEELDAEMKKFMKAELNKSLEEGISDETLLTAKDFEGAKGGLPWPTVGVVVAHFGNNKSHPVYKDIILPNNNGIDIQTGSNADVYSVFKGKVSKIFTIAGQGFGMIVVHGSYYTVYTKLSSIEVKPNDEVKANQKIARVRSGEEGSVFHFEIWKNMSPLDPELWLLK